MSASVFYGSTSGYQSVKAGTLKRPHANPSGVSDRTNKQVIPMQSANFSSVSSMTQRLIKARADSIIQDRIRTSDPAIFGRKLVTSPSYDVLLTESFLSLMIYPTSTAVDVARRRKKHRSSIPLLLAPPSSSRTSFLSMSGETNSITGGTFIGNMDTSSVFQLEQDCTLGLHRITVDIPERQIHYEVPILFTVAFGPGKRVTRADEHLDSAAVFYLTLWSDRAREASIVS